MREILFRGKSIRDNSWVYGYLVKHDEDRWVIIDKSLGTIGCGQQVFPETVGQFTGLFDARGTKIFEDDVVAPVTQRSFWRNGPNGPAKKLIVTWDECCCGFEPFSDSSQNCGHCGGAEDPGDCEVIGNFHDNLEFLKECRP